METHLKPAAKLEVADIVKTTTTEPLRSSKTVVIRLTLTACALVSLFVPNCVSAQMSAPNKPALTSPKLFVDPSSTKVSLGKASLIVTPLTHKGKIYVGNYELKVVPYIFKSENGTLELQASDETVRKLLCGTAVEFTGRATNNKKAKTKLVIGKVTPSANDRGSVTFSIATDNGLMIFKTSYHFSE